MSTSTVGGSPALAINLEGLIPPPPFSGSTIGQLGGSLTEAVEKFQAMVLKVQNVVQMIFAEFLGRLSSIMSCMQSFSVCIGKLEEAFCPKPIVSPALGESLKAFLASLNATPIPVQSQLRPPAL